MILFVHELKQHWKEVVTFGWLVISSGGRTMPLGQQGCRESLPAMKSKTTLQFGSDEGSEMAAAYHSITETVKMCVRSIWHFFGDFFKKVIDKNTDIRQCLPQNLGLSLAWN